MLTRISSGQQLQQSISAILDQQARIGKTQLQIASGERLTTAADDPAGAARLVNLDQAMAEAEQYRRNAELAQGRLALSENVMAESVNILQRARELALQGNNDSQTPESRAAIAFEVRQLLDELVALANERDASGEYLFAGYKGGALPFSKDAAGNVVYAGDDGSRAVAIGPDQQVVVGESGTRLFRAIRNGNGRFAVAPNPANAGNGVSDAGAVVDATAFTKDNFRIAFTSPASYDVINDTTSTTVLSAQPYSSGAVIAFNGVELHIGGTPAAGDSFTVTPAVNQDMFAVLRNLATDLESGLMSPAALARFHNGMNRTLAEIDATQNHVLENRARIGMRLGAVARQMDVNEAYVLQLEQTTSLIRDLDYAEAAGRLQFQLTVLQAAQQSFANVQNISLFDYLR